MRILLAAAFVAVFQFSSISQPDDTVRVYFDIDESQVKEKSILTKKQYDKAMKLFAAIRIFGYADFLHNSEYNIQLSARRAEAVKAKLLDEYPDLVNKIVTCEGLGEKFSRDNGSPEGEPQLRKAEIVFIYPVEGDRSQASPTMSATRAADSTPQKPLEELSKGESLTLEGLSFVPGRHVIMEHSKPVLAELLNTLREHPNLRIEIQGHVCCTERGEDGFDYDSNNYKLSENRAEAVYQYLIKNGISKSRLKYKGYAGKKPKVEEVSEETEQMNRRVEIMILEN